MHLETTNWSYSSLGADEILNQLGHINTLAPEDIIDPRDGTDEEITLMIPSQYLLHDR